METAIIIRYCEIHLKGKNRGHFEKMLKENIKKSLKGIDFKFTTVHSRYLIEDYDENDYDIIAEKTGAEPLHHTKPPRWAVGEAVFYSLADNAENDLPEIPGEFAETVEVIKQAIDARKLVEIEYFSQKLKKTVRLFAPEIIVIYKMQWYVAGFCKLREERRTFCLDGIKKIAPTNHSEPSHGIAEDVRENGLFNNW